MLVLKQTFGKRSPEPIQFLWKELIARKNLTILFGAPGVGKSYIGLAIAYELARKGKTVLIYSGEEAEGQVIAKLERLNDNNKDREPLNHIFFLPSGAIPTPDVLSTVLSTHAPDFILIDPLVDVTAGECSSNDNARVRLFLTQLTQLASEQGMAILGVHHEVKMKRGFANEGDLITGAASWGAVARCCIRVIGRDVPLASEGMKSRNTLKAPDKCGLLKVVKSNIGRAGFGYHYEIKVGTDSEERDNETVQSLTQLEVAIGDRKLARSQELDEYETKAEEKPSEKLARDELDERKGNRAKFHEVLDRILPKGSGEEIPTKELEEDIYQEIGGKRLTIHKLVCKHTTHVRKGNDHYRTR